MKLRVLFVCFLVFTQLSSAQISNWCPPGAEWYYDFSAFSQTGYVKLNYISDTTVDGQLCKKLVENVKYLEQMQGNIYEFSDMRFTYEAENVVYCYGFNGYQEYSYWDTLFNFNATIGDKWHLFLGGTDDYVQVVDTGHSLIQNMNLKWLVVKYYSSLGFPDADTLYERLGCVGFNYPFYTSVIGTDAAMHSFCNYSDDSFVDWHSDDLYCSEIPTVLISPSENLEVLLFPNPATDKITISITGLHEGNLITITNLIGQEVYAPRRFESDKVFFDIQSLPTGLYTVSLPNSNSKFCKY